MGVVSEKMRFIVISFFAFLLFFHKIVEISANTSVAERLASIPEEDREELEFFFGELVVNEPFGYTIFGNKPISFASYSVRHSRFAMTLDNMILSQGEQVWKKYNRLFNFKNFLFKFVLSQDKQWHDIYLINRKAVLEVVDRHLEDFQKILGRDMTSKSFLNKLECPDMTIQDVLRNNELLLGILLGFGHTNANAYQKRSSLISGIQNTILHPIYIQKDQMEVLDRSFFLFTRKKNLSHEILHDNPKSNLNELIDEFATLQNDLVGFSGDDGFLAQIRLPDFLVIKDDLETKNLLEDYRATQYQIIQSLSQRNLLEVILSKLESE